MRLVAWNANYNNNRGRSLEEVSALLEPLHADIIVLSEIARPVHDNPLRAHWFGEESPGLAVIVRNGLNLTAHPIDAGALPIIRGFEVTGRIRFNLIATWPVQIPGGASYHKILMSALDHYSEVLKSGPTVMAGDFNSNTRVRSQRRTHPIFVDRAHSLGLVSAYHCQTGEAHGEEIVGTYRYRSDHTFHLDYCFITSSLAGLSRMSVLCSEEWSRRSDHYPVLIDIPDDAITPVAKC